MENKTSINKPYFIIVLLLTIVLPIAFCLGEKFYKKDIFSFDLFEKWFIFFAVGIRLFLAGIRQITKPAFTAKEIFHINNEEVFPIVRELGFANFCFGLIGIVSLFLSQWRIVSAFGSGLYYGFAAVLHLIKKPAGVNEQFALITDILIFILLVLYCSFYF